jgi:transposase, IS5 family
VTNYHLYNRWVVLASLIPWGEFEDEYSSGFSIEMGAPAKPFRMALGALIIKEKLGSCKHCCFIPL